MSQTMSEDFYNFGYTKNRLPGDLYQSLLEECLNARNNERMVSGLSNPGVPDHFLIEKNRNNLIKFIDQTAKDYETRYPGVGNVSHVLDRPAPYVHGDIWVNLQKKNEFIPNHDHDGILSYTIWMKLPQTDGNRYEGSFEFTYLDVLGNVRNHLIQLTKNDEGSIIMFPATLQHCVYPFYSGDDVRISVSGNILLGVGN
jgi:hypothetical protein